MKTAIVSGLLAAGAASHSVAASAAVGQPKPKPNIVVFLSDDHSVRDSSVYGAKDVRTPNMERLAAAGLTFENAFVASPTCAPSRASLLTGLMPARNGAQANHTRPKPGIKLLPAYLKELGYEVVAIGKVAHYGYAKDDGFDLVQHDGFHDDEAVPAALKYLQGRTGTKPLAFFVGTNWPHVPWPKSGEGYDPAALKLPPTHFDTPATRAARAKYYAAITRFDAELGAVYDEARAKLGGDTLFLHTSDHGAQWPLGKWSLYDEGTHVPMIVSWPGVTKPGARTKAMVSWVDILPTLIEAAGGTPPEELDGRSFVPVLKDEKSGARERIFATHSGDGSMNVYPMRSVRTARWKYIWNLHPEFAYTTHIDKGARNEPGHYWRTWQAAAANDERAKAILARYRERPSEELYDLDADPYEQKNLASEPGHADLKRGLRRELEEWMASQGDEGTVFGTPQLLSDPEPERPDSPLIADKALTIRADVTLEPQVLEGVILAQGGNQQGYALHLRAGRPVFSVRQHRQLFAVSAPEAVAGKFSVEAKLEKDGAMELSVNGKLVARGHAAGMIAAQPGEELSVGRDTQFAVGDYKAPNPLKGKVENVRIDAQ